MRALERSCVDLGVRFQEGVEVLELLQQDQTLQGIRVRNAEGDLQTIDASEAVLCCGAWSAELLPELPIYPVKGQMLSLQGPKDALRRVIFGPGTYLVPRQDGLLVVGAPANGTPDSPPGSPPDKGNCGRVADPPWAKHWPPMERGWGFRPCTPTKALARGQRIFRPWLAAGTTATVFCWPPSPPALAQVSS